jgi:hypothetical protein
VKVSVGSTSFDTLFMYCTQAYSTMLGLLTGIGRCSLAQSVWDLFLVTLLPALTVMLLSTNACNTQASGQDADAILWSRAVGLSVACTSGTLAKQVAEHMVEHGISLADLRLVNDKTRAAFWSLHRRHHVQ